MGAYGSPELHPNLRDNTPQTPPKQRKCPTIFKRVSFWLCISCVVLEIAFDDTRNVTGMLLACCISVFFSEGIALLCNAIRGRKAKTNAIAVVGSIVLYLAIALYLGYKGR